MAKVNAQGWSEVLAHVCGCGVHGEEPAAEDSGRFQAPNLGEAVRDAVGEMCPHPAPLLPKGAGNSAFGVSRAVDSSGESMLAAAQWFHRCEGGNSLRTEAGQSVVEAAGRDPASGLLLL